MGEKIISQDSHAIFLGKKNLGLTCRNESRRDEIDNSNKLALVIKSGKEVGGAERKSYTDICVGLEDEDNDGLDLEARKRRIRGL